MGAEYYWSTSAARRAGRAAACHELLALLGRVLSPLLMMGTGRRRAVACRLPKIPRNCYYLDRRARAWTEHSPTSSTGSSLPPPTTIPPPFFRCPSFPPLPSFALFPASTFGSITASGLFKLRWLSWLLKAFWTWKKTCGDSWRERTLMMISYRGGAQEEDTRAETQRKGNNSEEENSESISGRKTCTLLDSSYLFRKLLPRPPEPSFRSLVCLRTW